MESGWSNRRSVRRAASHCVSDATFETHMGVALRSGEARFEPIDVWAKNMQKSACLLAVDFPLFGATTVDVKRRKDRAVLRSSVHLRIFQRPPRVCLSPLFLYLPSPHHAPLHPLFPPHLPMTAKVSSLPSLPRRRPRFHRRALWLVPEVDIPAPLCCARRSRKTLPPPSALSL